MSDSLAPATRTGAVLGVIGLLLAVGVGVVTFGQSKVCFFENVACASSHEPMDFRGRLFDYAGRPLDRADLLIHDSVYGKEFEARARTDGLGRFCIRAASGVGMCVYVAAVEGTKTSELTVRSSAPVDPRLSDPTLRESLRPRSPENLDLNFRPFMALEPVKSGPRPYSLIHPIGAYGSPELWNAETDTAASCEDIGAAQWYRYEDAGSSWQLWLQGACALATVALFLAARWTRRASLASRLGTAAGLLGLATVALLIQQTSIV